MFLDFIIFYVVMHYFLMTPINLSSNKLCLAERQVKSGKNTIFQPPLISSAHRIQCETDALRRKKSSVLKFCLVINPATLDLQKKRLSLSSCTCEILSAVFCVFSRLSQKSAQRDHYMYFERDFAGCSEEKVSRITRGRPSVPSKGECTVTWTLTDVTLGAPCQIVMISRESDQPQPTDRLGGSPSGCFKSPL